MHFSLAFFWTLITCSQQVHRPSLSSWKCQRVESNAVEQCWMSWHAVHIEAFLFRSRSEGRKWLTQLLSCLHSSTTLWSPCSYIMIIMGDGAGKKLDVIADVKEKYVQKYAGEPLLMSSINILQGLKSHGVSCARHPLCQGLSIISNFRPWSDGQKFPWTTFQYRCQNIKTWPKKVKCKKYLILLFHCSRSGRTCLTFFDTFGYRKTYL